MSTAAVADRSEFGRFIIGFTVVTGLVAAGSFVLWPLGFLLIWLLLFPMPLFMFGAFFHPRSPWTFLCFWTAVALAIIAASTAAGYAVFTGPGEDRTSFLLVLMGLSLAGGLNAGTLLWVNRRKRPFRRTQPTQRSLRAAG